MSLQKVLERKTGVLYGKDVLNVNFENAQREMDS